MEGEARWEEFVEEEIDQPFTLEIRADDHHSPEKEDRFEIVRIANHFVHTRLVDHCGCDHEESSDQHRTRTAQRVAREGNQHERKDEEECHTTENHLVQAVGRRWKRPSWNYPSADVSYYRE